MNELVLIFFLCATRRQRPRIQPHRCLHIASPKADSKKMTQSQEYVTIQDAPELDAPSFPPRLRGVGDIVNQLLGKRDVPSNVYDKRARHISERDTGKGCTDIQLSC